MSAAYIRTDECLTITWNDGKTNIVFSDETAFPTVLAAVKDSKWGLARDMLNKAELIQREFDSVDNTHGVNITDGIIFYNNIPIHNTLTDRILNMMDDGFNVSPMVAFLTNLMDNPSSRAVNELYDFLEESDLPITDDGHFLAYKRVRKDFKDIHSGTIDNSVGKVVTMMRNMVNEDKNQTCSDGLHFCSRSYLPYYGNNETCNTTVMVKINPKDVVSIPSDYSNAKGRCCRYEVMEELDIGDELKLEDNSVFKFGYDLNDDIDYDAIADWNSPDNVEIDFD